MDESTLNELFGDGIRLILYAMGIGWIVLLTWWFLQWLLPIIEYMLGRRPRIEYILEDLLQLFFWLYAKALTPVGIAVGVIRNITFNGLVQLI